MSYTMTLSGRNALLKPQVESLIYCSCHIHFLFEGKERKKQKQKNKYPKMRGPERQEVERHESWQYAMRGPERQEVERHESWQYAVRGPERQEVERHESWQYAKLFTFFFFSRAVSRCMGAALFCLVGMSPAVLY